MITTLNEIREHEPCLDGWEKLLKHLDKIKADDEPLEFSEILESNGLDDAIWCLRVLEDNHLNKIKLFALDCAEHVLPIYEEQHLNDDRPRKAIEAGHTYIKGGISLKELDAASAASAARAARAASAARAARAARAASAASAASAADEQEYQIKLFEKYFL